MHSVTPTLPAPVTLPALIGPPLVMGPEPTPALATPAPLMLFGRDDAGRPHAACFVGHETVAVERAASLMGLTFAAVGSDALRDLAGKLPVGRLFPASGKAFVPFTPAALYDRLLAATGTSDTPRPAKAASKPAEAGGGAVGGVGRGAGGTGDGGPAGKGGGTKAQGDWAELKVGSLVLAQDDEDGAYYFARIVATKADEHVVLAWENYPDLPEFSRARWALALLHPEAVARVLTP